MKNKISIIFAALLTLLVVGCEKDMLDKEQYESIIYLLSGNNNVYEHEIDLNDEVNIGYVTISSSGSLPVNQNVTVEIEDDTTSLKEWNYRNFDIKIEEYAKHLNPGKYDILKTKEILKAGNQSNKVAIPIKINAHGLSPDSIYMIPLKIKKVSAYSVNEKKENVLFRIYLKNDYCEVKTITNYFMRGELIRDSKPDKTIKIAASKRFMPLDSNLIRILPTTLPYKDDLDYINENSLVIKIFEDNTVEVLPYKTIEIESLEDSYYDPKEKKFYLNYRIKLDGEWNTVHEALRSFS